ncbi:phage tail protein, partial [Salmonella enterica subsp. enterica serovar Virginia]|nr:phage tail protein [Salmonella enterica subsp. enterica serovar Virginia]
MSIIYIAFFSFRRQTANGIVKLNSATNSTSTTEAATPSAVKAAYDLAKSKTSATNIYTR